MSPDMVVDVIRQAILLLLTLSSVLILPGLVVGFIMSILMAATQINEQALSFFPKLITTFLAAGILGPWILKKFIEFHNTIMHMIVLVAGGGSWG
jgi:flagellar biosynthesis protein FliQ